MVKWTVAVVALAGLGLGGCASKQEPAARAPVAKDRTSSRAVARTVAAEPVEVLQVVRGNNETLKRGGVTLVKDEAGLAKLGLDAIEGLSPNWAEEDVVVLAMGEQTTAGYWADIKGIQLDGDTLFVQGVVNRPGEGAQADVMTYPYAAAVIAETKATRAQGDYEEVVGQPEPE